MILIGDDRVKSIPCTDCGEPFVDLQQEYPDLHFDLDRHGVQKRSPSISIGRRMIGEMLLRAQGLLPDHYLLLVKEVYRPLSIQREFYEAYASVLRAKNPKWPESQILEECSKLNAPVDVAPHSTGGAVDVTLIYRNGVIVDMGTPINAEPLATEYATYTSALNISEEAQVRRAALVEAMSAAGFVNYPTEWWHWSYGDKYWALLSGAESAIFDRNENLLI